MSHSNKLFHVCHVMFSYGITKPEMAKSLQEIKQILLSTEDFDLITVMNDLVKEGYVGIYNQKYFLLGKGIIAVAAIFT